MAKIGSIEISPPILNSACPWASDLGDLKALYGSRFTGAVTTRTATLDGFPDDPKVHQVAFAKDSITSINSYGYSPYRLSTYIEWVKEIIQGDPESVKPIIISITSSADHNGDESGSAELGEMISMIQSLRKELEKVGGRQRIAIEINTSCPNIKDTPPPAYEPEKLMPLLESVRAAVEKDTTLTVGLKLPPYVYSSQFVELVRVVSSFSIQVEGKKKNPVAFFTCTNTLGSSLMYQSQTTNGGEGLVYAVPSMYGGLAGEALHSLALGNVHSFGRLLRESGDESLELIKIIGVGGVTTAEGVERMRLAGADAVACATALGKRGVSVFSDLSAPLI